MPAPYQQTQPIPAYQQAHATAPYQQPYAGATYPTYAPYTTPRPTPVSTLVLLAVSVVSLLATGIIGIPSAIISAIAWRRHQTDVDRAKRLTTIGWIVYAANFALGVPVLVAFYAWALSRS